MLTVLADVTLPEGDPFEVLGKIVEAAGSGNWRLVAAFALVLVMMVVGKFRDRLAIFRGDRGGALLVMVLALGGAVSTALMTDKPLDVSLFLGAVGTAFTAVGGFQWVKRLMKPVDKKHPASQ